MTLRGLDGRRADSKADLERDDKSPTRCKIARLSWKSLEAVSVCRQIRTRAPLLVTHCRRRLWRQSHTKDPFTAAEAGIPFQHRCHLSRRGTDAPRQARSFPGPRSQTCLRWAGPPRRGSEEKQPPELNPLNWDQILLRATRGRALVFISVTFTLGLAGRSTAH